jgi:UDP-glucose 4-epimerase
MSGRPKDIELHQVDLRSKKARDVFRAGDVDALVHLGVMHDPRARPAEIYSWNITGTTKLLEYCQAYRVPKVVLLSSANVYGPRPDNPQFLTEDAPLLAAQRFPEMRDLVEIDHMFSTFLWRARELETVILRPVHIVGPVHNAPSNYLRIPRPPVLLGFDPMVQLVHVEDVADAIAAALAPGRRGIYNITGPGELPLSAILTELRRDPRSIPHPLAKPVLSFAFALGISSFPVAELDFIRYVCMVDGRRAAAELAFRPKHGLRETIHAVDDPV